MDKNKKPTLEGIIVLISSILVAVILTGDVLTTTFVNNGNVINIVGHYDTVKRLRPGRGSLNYELFIREDHRNYQITADDADCFFYDDFKNEISKNQPINISIRQKNSLFKNSNLLIVVSITLNGVKYLDPECINENLKKNKKVMPLFALGILLLGFLFFKFKR